ncbi:MULTISPECIES: glycosyltransferase [Antarcticibacterium]|uniref:glycosyltransferase n=1 Tax=Antarcticibacterium TaxID=2058174 RepID=UPI00143CC363|nr:MULTISPECIES: glycosyltransferase [Antarcticibacterium]
MKVLYIIDTLNVAGAEQSLAEITTHFKHTEAIFVHIYPGETLKPYLLSKGVKVYSLNIGEKYGFKDAMKQLKTIYDHEAPDLIHSTLYRSDMIARKMKKFFPHIPLVGSFVNNSYTAIRYKNKSFFMKLKLWLAFKQDYYSARKVDFFISNSETIKEEEGNALHIPPSKITVIYRGRDAQRFEKITANDSINLKEELGLAGKKILLNVSRLIERKGQLDIIKVMPEILRKFPNAILLIAGEGSFRATIEKEILHLNLNEKVILLGKCTYIPELLSIADVFIYPSYAEGLPGALIEAMMSGCIIANSDIGENIECVGMNTSLTFPVGNLEKLKLVILNALNHPDNFRKLRVQAKKTAIEKFSIENIASKYESTYMEFLKK